MKSSPSAQTALSLPPCDLLPVEHLHEHLFNVHGPYDWPEEELGHHRGSDGPQHGQGDEQLGKAGRVLAVNQADVLVQSLVRLPTQ